MKILFYGDSITDAARQRGDTSWFPNSALGYGYVILAAGKLYEKSPVDYEIINKGISGNRIVDLYSRIKADVWNEKPDVISVLVGINDIWHELQCSNGVELDRFEKMYRIMLEDTIKALPDTKIILCEPFVTHGFATNEKFDEFLEVLEYAKVVKRLADELGLYFLPLQEKFESACEKYGEGVITIDGVHPSVQGATLLANEWIKLFEKIEKEVK